MPSISVDFDKRQLAAVTKKLNDAKIKIPKVLAAAVNDTAKQEKVQVSKRIRDKVNIKKKDIDKHIHFSRASAANPACVLRLSKSTRLGLKYFGARQTAKGVTYKIDKGGGRKRLPHAFGPGIARLGGQVYERKVESGKRVARLPIRKLQGPSPWGVFVKSGMLGPTKESIEANLRKNLDRRVKFELLKKSGRIK